MVNRKLSFLSFSSYFQSILCNPFRTVHQKKYLLVSINDSFTFASNIISLIFEYSWQIWGLTKKKNMYVHSPLQFIQSVQWMHSFRFYTDCLFLCTIHMHNIFKFVCFFVYLFNIVFSSFQIKVNKSTLHALNKISVATFIYHSIHHPFITSSFCLMLAFVQFLFISKFLLLLLFYSFDRLALLQL